MVIDEVTPDRVFNHSRKCIDPDLRKIVTREIFERIQR